MLIIKTPQDPANQKHSMDLIESTPMGRHLAESARVLINAYSEALTPSEQANFADTPARAVKGWCEAYDLSLDEDDPTDPKTVVYVDDFVTSILDRITDKEIMIETCKEVLSTSFPVEDGLKDLGIVTQGPISAWSVCPHHLLPVDYEVYVSYQPIAESVLGLSKLARLAQALAARPVLQEQYTADLASALYFSQYTDKDFPIPQIASAGSAVQVVGSHHCMACRGVRSSALTLTTVLRGSFGNDSLKDEFYRAVSALAAAHSTFPTAYANTPDDFDPLDAGEEEEEEEEA